MPWDTKKFLSGFNIFDGEKRGKVLFVCLIVLPLLIGGGALIYKVFIKPTTSQVQTLQNTFRNIQNLAVINNLGQGNGKGAGSGRGLFIAPFVSVPIQRDLSREDVQAGLMVGWRF